MHWHAHSSLAHLAHLGILLAFCTLFADPARLEPSRPHLSADEINAATYDGGPLPQGFCPLAVKLQVLLDEIGISPGPIYGVNGENLKKALSAFETSIGHEANGVLDAEVWARLRTTMP